MRPTPTQRTIMLIDDSEPARELVYWSLGGPSSLFHLIPVPSAEQALELLQDTRVDLIISDFHMPEMNGAELMEALVAEPHLEAVPVIMISADNDPDLAREARAAGAVDFLVKPFAPADLLGAVDEALSAEGEAGHIATGQLTIQTLIDSIPHMAMILDENHRVIIGNRAFFEQSRLGVSDCLVHCSAIHGEDGEPAGCPLTESVKTGVRAERQIHDSRMGDLVVSVYPLDITTEDGRRLYFHVARPVGSP